MGIVDLSRIQETSDGDLEFERELIGMYIDDAEEHVTGICSTDPSSHTEIKKLAHTLKGASANMGAGAVQAASNAIEQDASNGGLPNFDAQKVELQKAFEETRTFFNDYLASIEG